MKTSTLLRNTCGSIGLNRKSTAPASYPLNSAVLVAAAGGHEDDRHVPGALAAAHELGQLEAVHVGHLHVDQSQRHVVRQQELQGLAAGARLQELEVGSPQQRLQREQVFGKVVDQQALHGVAVLRSPSGGREVMGLLLPVPSPAAGGRSARATG